MEGFNIGEALKITIYAQSCLRNENDPSERQSLAHRCVVCPLRAMSVAIKYRQDKAGMSKVSEVRKEIPLLEDSKGELTQFL